jgi:CubicO group peptidase (beta-lactamase class C family)
MQQRQKELLMVNKKFTNNPVFGTLAANFASVHKIGKEERFEGQADFTNPNSKVDGNTMFGEGSVGKVRFAGLAYMMQENGEIDLTQKVTDFITGETFQKFIKRKYSNNPELTGQILELFSRDDNKGGTLSDLTTHFSGVGDNTRTILNTAAQEGISADWSLPKLLAHVNRNKDGEVLAMGEIKAEYNKHQYSNLGYTLLGEIIEAAANKKTFPDEPLKTYKDLFKERMLSKLHLTNTKFPEDITEKDNIALAKCIDATGKEVDTKNFKGASSAGGMFTSANDATEFFQEFFRGFPGTEEHGKDNVNKFFKKETIDLMTDEWTKKERYAGTENGNMRYQGPGFVVEIEGSNKNKIRSYDKNGSTYGYEATMVFRPASGEVDIKFEASENASIKSCAIDVLKKLTGKEYNPKDQIMGEKVNRVMAYIGQKYPVEDVRNNPNKIVQDTVEGIQNFSNRLAVDFGTKGFTDELQKVKDNLKNTGIGSNSSDSPSVPYTGKIKNDRPTDIRGK